jgi:hypothetical protein
MIIGIRGLKNGDSALPASSLQLEVKHGSIGH